MIDLSGDPLVVRRRNVASRQILKLDHGAIKAAKPLKLAGEVFRLTDNLESGNEVLPGAMTGSQIGFAFAQSETDGEEGEVEDAPAAEDATVVAVSADSGELGAARTTVIKTVEAEAALADLLAAAGLGGEPAKDVERVARERLQIEKLVKGDGIAVIGYRPQADTPDYVPAQVAIYRKGEFLAALAITDAGTYAESENPWFGQDIFREDEGGGAIAKQRLMDAIYGAAVRNNISTTVAGEIILMLSRSFDLEQPIAGDESITALFTSKARDAKSGLGKILYVRIDRAEGDAMECFVFQPRPKAAFECVSGKGEGGQSGGMVTPVKGVMIAKFGPGKDPVTKKRRMNTGVDWTAPPGSPVVAAFEGTVAFAGVDGKRGNTVKLAHESGTVTVYTNLKSFAANLVEGKRLRAGQRLGLIGHGSTSDEPLLHFEMLRNNTPVDPFGEYQSRVETGGAIEALVYRITTIESGNRCDAANPLSTAVGLGQFIQSTWLRIIQDHRPDLMVGRTRAQILALRTDCDLALAMTTALTRENASYIRAAGHQVTPGNLYLAHFLGPGGAAKALGSNRAVSIAEAMGAAVVKANPFLSGHDVAWLIEWAARKMAGKGKAPPSSTGPAVATTTSYAGNSAFAQFRDAIAALLG
jgi:hypothetical protein